MADNIIGTYLIMTIQYIHYRYLHIIIGNYKNEKIDFIVIKKQINVDHRYLTFFLNVLAFYICAINK